jgi:tRNA-guanine family transglycosylase
MHPSQHVLVFVCGPAQFSVTFADVMGDAPGCGDGSSSVVGGKLNLRDNRLRKEMVPIKQGCECFACKRHTRGYIHHLINTHEMLADVLLNMHNQHQYALFFGGIRDSIQAGKFDEYKERFLAKRRSA